MWFTVKPGRVDNAKLEARPDVLTCTTPVLEQDVEIIGEVSAEIFFRSSLPHADVFVRLCDVVEKGRSLNICDGLITLTDADEGGCARVELWPTAYRFKSGHRIRVQVSSGASRATTATLAPESPAPRRPCCAPPSSRSITAETVRRPWSFPCGRRTETGLPEVTSWRAGG
ncbi:CocE/NonD family hydrolase [Streptomyces sp. SID12501]|uniref:CocE/NonD family hydrolase n=1 Tax=Streptomyces sp. SID12501 TaxID=2706042 RepID=UPI001941DB6B